MGLIKAICISKKKGEKKTPVSTCEFVENHGIQGDVHAGAWHRQISLLADEDVDTMRQQGLSKLTAGDFAENVLLSGVSLETAGLGSLIRLGADVELSVTQIGKTCHARCAIYAQAGDCIMPRKGLFARVVKGGKVKIGDPAEIVAPVPRDRWQLVVLTISDRCSRGETVDTAGPATAKLVTQALGANLYRIEIIPDDQARIEERLKHYADGHSIDLILAVGGTGFAPRDVTPEAVAAVIERPTPGLDEVMRRTSSEKTPRAMLSRAVSGIRGSTLIISLPGSERGAIENLEALLPALGHGLQKLRGDPADCGRVQADSP